MLNEIISEEYTGVRGGKGADGFTETINSVRMGFPDINWNVEDLVAEGNKVIVRWSWKGKNKDSIRILPVSKKRLLTMQLPFVNFQKTISSRCDYNRTN